MKDDVTSEAEERLAEARAELAEARQELEARARDRADRLTSEAGRTTESVSRALAAAGESLDADGEDRLAHWTEDAAGRVERWGSYLQDRDPSRMVADLRDLARTHPALFLGGSLAAGVALGRFLRASEPSPSGPESRSAARGDGRRGRTLPARVPDDAPPGTGPEGASRSDTTRAATASTGAGASGGTGSASGAGSDTPAGGAP